MLLWLSIALVNDDAMCSASELLINPNILNLVDEEME